MSPRGRVPACPASVTLLVEIESRLNGQSSTEFNLCILDGLSTLKKCTLNSAPSTVNVLRVQHSSTLS